jgi:iron complex transport system substrate-binding protein
VIVTNNDMGEALKILGVEDKIIAISKSIKDRPTYYPELAKKQVVGPYDNLDFEMIGEIAKGGMDEIEPNIIVLGYAYPDKPYGVIAVEKSLAPFKNILCAGFEINKPDNFVDAMKALGVIFGKEAEANEYIGWFNEKTEEVKKAVHSLNQPTVYIESSSISPKIGELTTAGKGNYVDQLTRTAGGYNVARNMELSWPKVDWEWVVKQNPEFIIMTKYASPEKLGWDKSPSTDTVNLEKIIDEVRSRPGASSISAINNNRVYVVDSYKLTGPENIVGLTYIAKILHPDLDFDFDGLEKEYFLRSKIESRDAISFYPEIENK